MTKRDLVVRISKETGLVQQTVFEVVQKTFDYITEALASGKKVELRNFGIFEIRVRKARIGRNPKAPTADVRIPSRTVVKFKAGKKMGDTVLRLSPKKPAKSAKPETAQTPGPPPPAVPPTPPAPGPV